jgi:small subunit ribosomal protein S16
MVVIRLARGGIKKKPHYRITVADSRCWRDGKYIEVIGSYNPFPSGQEKKIQMDLEKAKEWISKGAQPTARVKTLMKLAEASSN